MLETKALSVNKKYTTRGITNAKSPKIDGQLLKALKELYGRKSEAEWMQKDTKTKNGRPISRSGDPCGKRGTSGCRAGAAGLRGSEEGSAPKHFLPLLQKAQPFEDVPQPLLLEEFSARDETDRAIAGY